MQTITHSFAAVPLKAEFPVLLKKNGRCENSLRSDSPRASPSFTEFMPRF